MKSYDVIFVGGGLASVRGAFHLRQLNSDISIAIISNETELPYDRPPLSKEFLKGEKQLEDFILYPLEDYRKNKIDLLLNTHVSVINPENHILITSASEEFSFRKLFLATGGTPRRLPFDLGESDRICYLRTIADAGRIRQLAEESQKAAIIGGGFIGLEVATALAEKGLEVHLYDRDPYLWKRFLTHELSKRLEKFADYLPIHFHFKAEIYNIEEKGCKIWVRDKNNSQEFDFVCIGIGIELNLELARQAGLEINRGVKVNSFMQTSHPDIYAGGDITEFRDPYLEQWRVVEHWGHAEFSGLVAATHIAGQEYAYNLLNYAWTDIFNQHIEMAGDISSSLHILIRGNIHSDSWILLYLKENILKGYMAVNGSPKDYPVLQKWIKNKINLEKILIELKNPDIKLRELNDVINS